MFVKVLTFILLLGCAIAQSEDVESELTDRIVGGTNAPSGLAPYQVSLRTTSNSHFCGGSIISNRWIVTAAHCLRAAYPAYIVAGSIYLNSGGTRYITFRAFIHSGYNGNTLVNDIGMIQTREIITFNNLVRPIAIPTSTAADNTVLTATGWGLTVAGGSSLPNNLQVFYPKVYNQGLCNQRWGGFIVSTMMCTYIRVGQGLCQGDSGGPLVAGGFLHGIVSFGRPCAVGYPDVVTRVSSYRSWILAVQAAYP